MFGKSATSLHKRNSETKPNAALSLALAAVLLAVVGLFSPNSSLFANVLPSCNNGLTVKTGVSYNGVDGVDGISAYAVWLNQGNDGDEAAFLKSLIGTKGANGYVGKQGASAYQQWLDVGNTGTSAEFLNSLIGDAGVDGVAGLSAYELWLSTGHNGSLAEFLNSLTGASGAAGATGSSGANGLSAYEIWRNNGHTGETVEQFLTSLKGTNGTNGSNGTNGTNGANGVDGSPGPSGPAGPAGPAGANGTCTIGIGYYGSFWDEQTQSSAGAVNGMILRKNGSANGISIVDGAGNPSSDATPGSLIKFHNSGTYNIAFSAQLNKLTGNGTSTISIWLRQNGQNIAYTNTNLALDKVLNEMVAAWNFFVTVSAGDTVEVAWHGTDSTVVIQGRTPYTDGGANIPGIPSVILTVNQVS
ncbi:MAG: hypothetical protein ACKOWR_04605 [Micrococcales bacterium]